ncbi:HalOD1 output domain-containing protein [Halomarina ordinaria]|uniref:HalOD1 output domain-containing protein n=1 Tax=Halomarina ordinaria TaxID=3033939 RepID=A0ABD5UHV4_9EURY|nr:HalOD1 output domain-containing protein [Halomarina sp. PSRA2]
MGWSQAGGERDVPMSTAVVEAIAAAERVDPVYLDPPLHEVIDADALDAMFEGTLSAGVVAFEYGAYRVRAHDDGRVELRRPAEPPLE